MENNKLKIGIFTTFSDLSPEYSLASVVVQQLKALLKGGYQPVLFTLNIFHDEKSVPEGVELRKTIPQLVLEPYGKGDLSHFEDDSEKVQQELEKCMLDIDVCLTHDIIFINSFLPYNNGMRKAIDGKLDKVRWLHWIHSAPSIRPQMDGSPYDLLYTLPKNSKLIYMNHTDVVRAAEMYGTMPEQVRVIFNPMDIRELYDFHPLTRKIVDDFNLLNADVVDIYPLSTPRMGDSGKQLGKVIEIMGNIKRLGKNVRLVVCNAHANAQREKDSIEKMYEYALTKGLTKEDLIFTSLVDTPKWEHGVPHKVISDLFLLSNVFIFPSVSENCPLVLLEAMAAKNLLVLNYSFPAMRDFAGEHAMYFRFGSLVDNPSFPQGEDKYLRDVAILILSELKNNKALNANKRFLRKFNLDYIFNEQLSTAIMEIYNGESK